MSEANQDPGQDEERVSVREDLGYVVQSRQEMEDQARRYKELMARNGGVISIAGAASVEEVEPELEPELEPDIDLDEEPVVDLDDHVEVDQLDPNKAWRERQPTTKNPEPHIAQARENLRAARERAGIDS